MQGTGAHFPALAESHKLPIAVTCPLPDTDPQTQHGMTLAHDYRTQEPPPLHETHGATLAQEHTQIRRPERDPPRFTERAFG